jgi:WD40 repeat protein
MPPSPDYDVFLAHHTPEKEAATWLEHRLRQEGLRAFLDDRDLLAGRSLPAEIQRGFLASRSFALLLGPSGLGDWQGLEIDMAIQRTLREPYPILVVTLPGADLADLPPALQPRLRVDFSAGLEDEAALQRLVLGIRGEPSSGRDAITGEVSPPAHRSMAPRPAGFVPRSELETVLAALLGEAEPAGSTPGTLTVALTTALRGAGGFGKTALAQAVCAQAAVRQRYPAGILWTTLGQGLNEADRLARVRDLLRWWTRKEPPRYETLEAAAGTLRQALSAQRILLVLDDVWLAADVEPFAGIAPPAALLLTTRNTRALPSTTRAVVVDALEMPRAVELLGQGLASLPPARTVERLAQRLGEWPILLRLVNAQLREEYRAGLGAIAAFQTVERALDDAGLTAFDREDETARNLAVRRTVEASLGRLVAEDRRRYGQLAVFAEDQRVPMSVLEILWEVPASEVHRLCLRLEQMSLLYSFDPVGRWMQLHDVMRAYLLGEHRDDMPAFHGGLADRSLDLERVGGAPQDIDLYFVSRLPYHLKEAGREPDLERLLFSYTWLERKLAIAGVNAAMADYRLLPGNPDATRVEHALRLSRSVLTADPSQLASHLHGRLAGSPSPAIAGLLAAASPGEHRPWLRPLAATFEEPSGPFAYSFHAHAGEVRAIVQLDAGLFATAATDEEVRVWDFATGEQRAALASGGGPVRRLAAVPARRLLAGGDDGIVRLWDLDDERVLRTFAGNASPVTALCRRDEEFVAGHDDGSLLLWNLSGDRPLRSYQGHTATIHGVGFLDARTMVSIGNDRTLRVWNTVSARQLKALVVSLWSAQAMEVTASNEVILGAYPNEIQVWKPLSPQTRPRRSFRHRAIGIDAFCMLGRDLGASTVGGQAAIQLWNPQTGTLGNEIHVPGNGVSSMARFGASHLLCGSKDGTVSAWAIEGLKQPLSAAPPSSVYALAALDATTVVATAAEGRLQVWNVPEARLSRTLAGHTDTVSSVCALGPDRIASSSWDFTIRIWNARTGEVLRTLTCPDKPGPLCSLFADHIVCAPLATPGEGKPLQIWDVSRGEKVADVPAFGGGAGALAAFDDRFLLVGTYDGIILHLDISVAADRRNLALRGHERGVFSLAVLDRKHIASGSLDTTIRLWDLTTQETVRILRGHEKEVMGLAALAPTLLASASADQTIRLWDLGTGACLATLHLDRGLSSLTVMPDGSTLVAGDAAGKVHFLRLMGLPG